MGLWRWVLFGCFGWVWPGVVGFLAFGHFSAFSISSLRAILAPSAYTPASSGYLHSHARAREVLPEFPGNGSYLRTRCPIGLEAGEEEEEVQASIYIMKMSLKKQQKTKRYLPDPIVMQILLCVPYKSLARFKSVCKQWRDITCDRKFLDEYRHRSAANPSYFFVCTGSFTSSRRCHLYSLGRHVYTHLRTLSTTMPGCYDRMLPSSYGLVCLHDCKSSRSIAIFNPTTQEIISLPDFPLPYKAFIHAIDIGLPQPLGRFYGNELGFGFDPHSNKYKVVQLVRDSTGSISSCYVLTVGRRAKSSSSYTDWRLVETSLYCDPYTLTFWGVVVCAGGALYWEIEAKEYGEYIQIVMFDLSNETIKMIPSPGKFQMNVLMGAFEHLVEMQGKLCFSEVVREAGLLLVDIWTLEHFGRQGADWARLHRLELGLFPGPNARVPFFPVCIKDGIIILKDRYTLYSYDIKEKNLQFYQGDGDDTLTHWLLKGYAIVHAETLVLLD